MTRSNPVHIFTSCSLQNRFNTTITPTARSHLFRLPRISHLTLVCYTSWPLHYIRYDHPNADPSGRAWVRGRSLCWDCGFEYCRRYGCLSVVSAVCCQVEVCVTSWSLVQRRSIECGVSDLETWTWFMKGCPAMGGPKEQYLVNSTTREAPHFAISPSPCHLIPQHPVQKAPQPVFFPYPFGTVRHLYRTGVSLLSPTLLVYLINKYISLSDICLIVHHWYK